VPSSFYYTGEKTSPCILYTLRARVDDNSLNKNVLLPSIMGKRRFIVSN